MRYANNSRTPLRRSILHKLSFGQLDFVLSNSSLSSSVLQACLYGVKFRILRETQITNIPFYFRNKSLNWSALLNFSTDTAYECADNRVSWKKKAACVLSWCSVRGGVEMKSRSLQTAEIHLLNLISAGELFLLALCLYAIFFCR